ncbi:solute carrier organic anion transporter family member 74D-like isoform X1 [Ornithodoros turicata]|uniref:solute carrier organic anion transporter family member 74D-like isoform X1 n=1 Tax=Ornithodoros turicata TaxID=34597 RepID=UPI003138A5B8
MKDVRDRKNVLILGTARKPQLNGDSKMPSSKATEIPNGKSHPDDHPNHERDYLCGLGSFRPKCLQFLATPKVFFLVYSIMGILQGAYKTYFVGTMSTIERRFGMSSKTTGVILIADNLSPIIINLLAGYYASRISRPKIMAFGTLIVVLSCLLSILPFAVYGPGLHILEGPPDKFTRKRSDEALLCSSDRAAEDCSAASAVASYLPLVLFFVANFLNGFGGSTFFIVGSSYMDDNIRKKNSPMYFGMGFAFRLLGPVLGFLTASLCLRFYEDPFHDPGITQSDPRWIGAWWMGYIIFAIGLAMIALPMMLFPRILPSGKDYKVNNLKKIPKNKSKEDLKVADKSKTGEEENHSVIKDMAIIVKRLAKNPIFMLKTVGLVFILNATAGYGTSFSKYVEFQFGQTASKASFYSGSAKVLTTMIGILVGAVVIHRFRPRPTVLAGYSAVVEVAYLVGFVAMMFIGCDNPVISGVSAAANTTSSLTTACNVNCDCTTQIYEPVCSSDGTTSFFSACYAGCTSVGLTEANKTMYTDCSCVGAEAHLSSSLVSSVTKGLCGQHCDKFMLFLGVIIAGQLLGSTARTGSMLIYLRCVDPVDKSMALGATASLLNLLAFIPYPLVYGAILDSSCMIWEDKCGNRGNCWVYDIEKLRYMLHLVTIGFLAFGSICYIGVTCFSKRIVNFYEDDFAESTDDNDAASKVTEAVSVDSVKQSMESVHF